MKEIVEQVLKEYFLKMREPKLEELQLWDTPLLQTAGCCFVTLYKNGEVRWSAGNVKEIHPNLALECIANTMQALTGDKRFSPLTLEEAESIQIRTDTITARDMIHSSDIESIDPVKCGMIAIHRDYEKLAVVLPNMSPKLMTGNDFIPVLKNKLNDASIDDKNYILYKIETNTESNY